MSFPPHHPQSYTRRVRANISQKHYKQRDSWSTAHTGPVVGERADTERENSPAVAGAVVVGDAGPLIYTGLLTTSTL